MIVCVSPPSVAAPSSEMCIVVDNNPENHIEFCSCGLMFSIKDYKRMDHGHTHTTPCRYAHTA